MSLPKFTAGSWREYWPRWSQAIGFEWKFIRARINFRVSFAPPPSINRAHTQVPVSFLLGFVPFPPRIYRAVGTEDYQSRPYPSLDPPSTFYLAVYPPLFFFLVLFIRTPRPECRWPDPRLRLFWVIVLLAAETTRFCTVVWLFAEKNSPKRGYFFFYKVHRDTVHRWMRYLGKKGEDFKPKMELHVRGCNSDFFYSSLGKKMNKE